MSERDYMASVRWAVTSAVAGAVSVGLFTLAGIGFYRQMPGVQPVMPHVGVPPTGIRGAAPAAPLAEVVAAAAALAPPGYYDQLRARLHWVERPVGRQMMLTPDYD